MDGFEGALWLYLIWRAIKALPALFRWIGRLLPPLLIVVIWPLLLAARLFRLAYPRPNDPALTEEQRENELNMHLFCGAVWALGIILYFALSSG